MSKEVTLLLLTHLGQGHVIVHEDLLFLIQHRRVVGLPSTWVPNLVEELLS